MAEPSALTHLPIEGCRVSRLLLDYRFGLGFYEGPAAGPDYEVFIATAFTCSSAGLTERHDPREGPASFGLAYSLLHAICAEACADENGGLIMRFDNGVSAEVLPHDRYEAWEFVELNPPPRLQIIATPGGGLAIWEGRTA